MGTTPSAIPDFIGIPHPATLNPYLKKLWCVGHFAPYKLPGALNRFARNGFAALPEYIVEAVRGGHFMHREYPEAFPERVLAHL